MRPQCLPHVTIDDGALEKRCITQSAVEQSAPPLSSNAEPVSATDAAEAGDVGVVLEAVWGALKTGDDLGAAPRCSPAPRVVDRRRVEGGGVIGSTESCRCCGRLLNAAMAFARVVRGVTTAWVAASPSVAACAVDAGVRGGPADQGATPLDAAARPRRLPPQPDWCYGQTRGGPGGRDLEAASCLVPMLRRVWVTGVAGCEAFTVLCRAASVVRAIIFACWSPPRLLVNACLCGPSRHLSSGPSVSEFMTSLFFFLSTTWRSVSGASPDFSRQRACMARLGRQQYRPNFLTGTNSEVKWS